MNPYIHGTVAFCCSNNHAVFLAVKKKREVNTHNQCETRVYRLFGELLLSLKDMAANYSKLAQALVMHELLLLTVIIVLSRRQHKRKHRHLGAQYHKETTATRCTA